MLAGLTASQGCQRCYICACCNHAAYSEDDEETKQRKKKEKEEKEAAEKAAAEANGESQPQEAAEQPGRRYDSSDEESPRSVLLNGVGMF